MDFKVGDKVAVVEGRECEACKGLILTIVNINSNSIFPIRTVTDEGEEEIFPYDALEHVNNTSIFNKSYAELMGERTI